MSSEYAKVSEARSRIMEDQAREEELIIRWIILAEFNLAEEVGGEGEKGNTESK